EKRRAFAARNPESARLHEEARRFLPGGHTRTILSHEPFALTFVRGEGAVLTDADGHEYVDLLGDYTAGLLGHGERRVLDAADLSRLPPRLRRVRRGAAGARERRRRPSARGRTRRADVRAIRARPRALHELGNGSEPDGDHRGPAVHRAVEGAGVPRRLPRRRPLLLGRHRALERALRGRGRALQPSPPDP